MINSNKYFCMHFAKNNQTTQIPKHTRSNPHTRKENRPATGAPFPPPWETFPTVSNHFSVLQLSVAMKITTGSAVYSGDE